MKKLILFLICTGLLILTLTFTGCEQKEIVFERHHDFGTVMIFEGGQ